MSMTYGKYVIVKEGGLEVAICFDNLLPHSTFKNFNPVAAGFFEVLCMDDAEGVYIFGKSVSLDLSSREDRDNHLIFKILKGKYL